MCDDSEPMASCTTCGTTLPTSSKFCSSCGTVVKPEPEALIVRTEGDRVDPLASTAPASFSPARKLPANAGSHESGVSPKAETGFQVPLRDPLAAPAHSATPAQNPAPKPRSVRGQTAPLASVGRPPAQPVRSAHARAPVAKAVGIALGDRVLVQWANGQKYPGVVEQLAGVQCLVRFDTGERRWVESRYVVPA